MNRELEAQAARPVELQSFSRPRDGDSRSVPDQKSLDSTGPYPVAITWTTLGVTWLNEFSDGAIELMKWIGGLCLGCARQPKQTRTQ